MTKSPIETVFDAVPFERVENPNMGDGTLPYVVMRGVLNIAGLSLRCYVLNDGQRIFDAEDLDPFIEALTSGGDA